VKHPETLSFDADCFHFDPNFARTRSGDFRFDEFEDFRPSGFRKLDWWINV